MNKKILGVIIILVLIIGIIIGYFIFTKKDNTVWITDYEFLYDKAIEYIAEEITTSGHDKDKEDYMVFTDYEGFGIEEKDNKKYVYMWILSESYYVEDNTLKSSEGSSMPYKFSVENNEVVGYEIPKDGDDLYVSSIKEMFPDSIENKVLSYEMDNSNLEEKVKEYYSYLDMTEDETNIDNKVTTIDIQTTGLSSVTPMEKYTLNQEEIYVIFNIINKLTFSTETCDGFPDYYINYNSEEENGFVTYGIEIFDNAYHITSDSKGEAILSQEQKEELDKIITKYFN